MSGACGCVVGLSTSLYNLPSIIMIAAVIIAVAVMMIPQEQKKYDGFSTANAHPHAHNKATLQSAVIVISAITIEYVLQSLLELDPSPSV